jgi:hypothetical protein
VAQGCRGIPKTVANATAVSITRPTRGGPGGDITGTPATIGTYTAGLHRVRHQLFKRPDGREQEIVGELAVDGFDSDGAADGITEGDLASFTLVSGRTVVEQEVVSVQEYAPGGRLSWVVLSLGG